MEIRSSKYKNQFLKIEGEVVKFDEGGKAKVSKELGQIIEEQYGELLNPAVKKIEEVKPEVKSDNVEVNKLKSANNVLEDKVKELTDKLKVSEDATENWKKEYSDLKETLEGGEYIVPQEGEIRAEVEEQDVRLILGLVTKKVDELSEVARQLELPEEEWVELKKEDLIIYLSLKAINAKS